MENNWSPPSFKWTVSRISLNVTARWIRGSASPRRPCAQWHFSQVSRNVPVTPDLCPSGVHDTSWKKWEKVRDGNEASQDWAEQEESRDCYGEAARPALGRVEAQELSCADCGTEERGPLSPSPLLPLPSGLLDMSSFIRKHFWKWGSAGF